VMDQIVNEGCIVEIRLRKGLPGHRGADDGEDARPDDSADAQRSQRPRPKRLLERMFGLLRVADELVD
jgi:hypothetical protein